MRAGSKYIRTTYPDAVWTTFYGKSIKQLVDLIQRNQADSSLVNYIAAARIMDEQLGRTAYLAGDAFSYGDIPVGIMIYRYVRLIPDRPSTPNLDRWYAALEARPAFKTQVAAVPLT